MDKTLIISQPWGGLGDQMQYSTIPELCAQNGIDCYISDKNVYRNPEIKQLVWDCNPYVKGISTETPNAGSCTYNGGVEGASSIIDSVEFQHGFPMTNHLPIIYYKPKLIEEYTNSILIDISAKSASYKYKEQMKEIKGILMKYYNSNNAIILNPEKDINSDYFNIDKNIPTHKYKNIFEYTDLIYSCKKFICLWSGGSVLAAAIGRFKDNMDVECYVDRNQEINFGWGFYFFNNIKYKNL